MFNDTIRKGPAGQPGAELDWAYIEKPAEAFGEGPGREGMAAAVRGLSSGMGPR